MFVHTYSKLLVVSTKSYALWNCVNNNMIQPNIVHLMIFNAIILPVCILLIFCLYYGILQFGVQVFHWVKRHGVNKFSSFCTNIYNICSDSITNNSDSADIVNSRNNNIGGSSNKYNMLSRSITSAIPSTYCNSFEWLVALLLFIELSLLICFCSAIYLIMQVAFSGCVEFTQLYSTHQDESLSAYVNHQYLLR